MGTIFNMPSLLWEITNIIQLGPLIWLNIWMYPILWLAQAPRSFFVTDYVPCSLFFHSLSNTTIPPDYSALPTIPPPASVSANSTPPAYFPNRINNNIRNSPTDIGGAFTVLGVSWSTCCAEAFESKVLTPWGPHLKATLLLSCRHAVWSSADRIPAQFYSLTFSQLSTASVCLKAKIRPLT